jgi:hypothetical protein
MKPVNILIPDDLRQRADVYAATKGISFAKLVRQLLEAHLNRYAKSTRLAGGEK